MENIKGLGSENVGSRPLGDLSEGEARLGDFWEKSRETEMEVSASSKSNLGMNTHISGLLSTQSSPWSLSACHSNVFSPGSLPSRQNGLKSTLSHPTLS